MKSFLVIISGVLLVTLAGIFYIYSQQERTAFFYNQKVFSQFKGKVELETKLIDLQNKNKRYLDSLTILIREGRIDIQDEYGKSAQMFQLKEQQLTEKYTADIWHFINEGVQEYGEKNDYDYIFGAVGDGSLMYANEKNDITDEVIVFINEKYGK